MTRPLASLSLDLDNLWSYMKIHGDAGWEAFPSYLDLVVPRILGVLEAHSLRITVFVVGQDAALSRNHNALRMIADAGHEIGNHSFHHEPWLHLYSPAEVAAEIDRADNAIEDATGRRPHGFRGPGYSLSQTVLETLKARDYAYDCSTFPTFIGPAARAYYFLKSGFDRSEKSKRSNLFGSMRDGLRPLKPYQWALDTGSLLEVPVTTMPVLRSPFHFSYAHWLASFSEPLSQGYFNVALRACDISGIAPSLLLHPLDFLGCDDVSELAFFPGMDQTGARKMTRMTRLLEAVSARYDVLAMEDFAATVITGAVPVHRPNFDHLKTDAAGAMPMEAGGQ
ncbi:MAG: polysaccharide deacetylase family protein [Pseudomonadota bacterium]